MPTISIITICFNNLEELKDTCASVDTQSHPPYEHLIIDGSTNGEVEHYLTTTTQPEYRRWKCEPDKGIADAFNKGLKMAMGDVVNMLNSGDCYYHIDVLKQVQAEFVAYPNVEWLHAMYQLERGGKSVIIGKPFEFAKLYRGMRSVCHQTMFVKRELHDRYGGYNSQWTIAMDYDFVCRIAKEPMRFVDEPWIRFAPQGISQTQYMESLRQNRAVYSSYNGKSFKLLVWNMRLLVLHLILCSPVGRTLYNVKVRLGLANI